MTDDLIQVFNDCSQNEVKNIIMHLGAVSKMDTEAALVLCDLQQKSYEQNHSLVFCHIDKQVEAWLDEQEILEIMNVTPTLSEAMDIVQMEEIEREMFGEE